MKRLKRASQRQRNEALDCRALAVCALHSRLLAGLNLNGWCDQFMAMLAPPMDSAVSKSAKFSDSPKPNGVPAVTRSKWMDF